MLRLASLTLARSARVPALMTQPFAAISTSKRPPNAYARFGSLPEIAKELSTANGFVERVKLQARLWAEASDDLKMKLKEETNAELQQYKDAKAEESNHVVPPSGLQLFAADPEVTSTLSKYSGSLESADSPKRKKLQKMWDRLTPAERKQYIDQSLENFKLGRPAEHVFGKPESPFNYFVEKCQAGGDMSNLRTLASKWKQMSRADRRAIEDEFNQKFPTPEKPKRPLNAFMLFSQQTRPTLQNLSQTETLKKLGELWHDLAPEKKAEYTEAAKRAQAEYQTLRPQAEKRPASGYQLFVKEKSAEVSNMAFLDRLGEIARLWKNLPAEQREVYLKRASDARAEFAIQHPPKVKLTRPPSVYAQFVKEMLQHHEFPAGLTQSVKLREIAKIWHQMPEAEKERRKMLAKEAQAESAHETPEHK